MSPAYSSRLFQEVQDHASQLAAARAVAWAALCRELDGAPTFQAVPERIAAERRANELEFRLRHGFGVHFFPAGRS